MPKKRTKREKQSANYSFLINWQEAKKLNIKNNVKGQIESPSTSTHKKTITQKNAKLMEKERSFEANKKDILRSILLSFLIISLELVLYLVWR